MFKWVRNKIIKGLINDLYKEMPVYKAKAIEYFEEHKDEILEKVKEFICNLIKEKLTKEKLQK